MFVQKYRLLLLMCLLGTQWGMAQVSDPEPEETGPIQSESIEVVRLYEPILAKAKKITITPDPVPSSSKQAPTFNNYQVPNRFLTLSFDPPKLKPLALKNKSQKEEEDLFNFWLKAGFGNYWTPYADLTLSSNRPNDNIFGLNLKHHSSRLSSDFPQDFMENAGKLYGKFFGDKVYLDANIGYEHDRYFYYAIEPEDSIPQLLPERDDIGIVYQTIPLQLELGNIKEHSSEFEHKTNFNYHYFWSNRDQSEHNFMINSALYKDTQNGIGFGTELYFDYTSYSDTVFAEFNEINTLAFSALPNVFWKQPFGEVKLGASLMIDQDEFVPYPYLFANIHLLEKYLNVYAGWDKQLIHNNYRKLTALNPFLNQIQPFFNTRKESRYLGFKGNIGAGFTYDVSGGQFIFENQPLFDNYFADSSQFKIVYDSSMTSFGGKVSLAYLLDKKTNIHATATYYTYDTDEEQHAWHLPNLTFNLGMDFALTKKLNLGADFVVLGKRKAKETDGSITTLKEIIDLNLNLDYKLSKNLYFFVDVNNIIHSKYQRYLHYPAYGINFLGGIILRY